MKKSILFASLVIMTSTVLGMSGSNRRSIPSDGFGEQQQGRKVRILEEASTSQTPNIQSVRDNRDVEKLTRYLFDLISERESANETERDAITERIRVTGISEDIEREIEDEVERIRWEIGEDHEYLEELLGRIRERIGTEGSREREMFSMNSEDDDEKEYIEQALRKISARIRMEKNIAPNAVYGHEAEMRIDSLNSEVVVYEDFERTQIIEEFPVKYATVRVNEQDCVVAYTIANWSGRKANIVRVLHDLNPDLHEEPETKMSRVVKQDGNWDIVVPQFENGQIVDKNYRVVSQNGQIEYDTLNFLHQALVQLPRHDQNLDNLLIKLLRVYWEKQFTDQSLKSTQQLDMYPRQMDYYKKQNELLIPFIIKEASKGNISFSSHSDFSVYLFGVNSLFLNEDKNDTTRLQKQHELLESIISDSLGNLKICEIKKELYVTENDLYISAVIDYLNRYKNSLITSKSDLVKIFKKNQKKESERMLYLNILKLFQEKDKQNSNLQRQHADDVTELNNLLNQDDINPRQEDNHLDIHNMYRNLMNQLHQFDLDDFNIQ